eukprot:c31428_g1_i1 orf=55-222(+)
MQKQNTDVSFLKVVMVKISHLFTAVQPYLCTKTLPFCRLSPPYRSPLVLNSKMLM